MLAYVCQCVCVSERGCVYERKMLMTKSPCHLFLYTKLASVSSKKHSKCSVSLPYIYDSVLNVGHVLANIKHFCKKFLKCSDFGLSCGASHFLENFVLSVKIIQFDAYTHICAH